VALVAAAAAAAAAVERASEPRRHPAKHAKKGKRGGGRASGAHGEVKRRGTESSVGAGVNPAALAGARACVGFWVPNLNLATSALTSQPDSEPSSTFRDAETDADADDPTARSLHGVRCAWGKAQEPGTLHSLLETHEHSDLREVGLCLLDVSDLPAEWGLGDGGKLPPIGASPDGVTSSISIPPGFEDMRSGLGTLFMKMVGT